MKINENKNHEILKKQNHKQNWKNIKKKPMTEEKEERKEKRKKERNIIKMSDEINIVKKYQINFFCFAISFLWAAFLDSEAVYALDFLGNMDFNESFGVSIFLCSLLGNKEIC